jgi:hypothetical protein
MIDTLGQAVKSKEGKSILIMMGVVVLSLTAVHYYHQIKLAKLNIEAKEKGLKK